VVHDPYRSGGSRRFGYRSVAGVRLVDALQGRRGREGAALQEGEVGYCHSHRARHHGFRDALPRPEPQVVQGLGRKAVRKAGEREDPSTCGGSVTSELLQLGHCLE